MAMAIQITYRGATLWDNTVDGAGYSFRPGASKRDVIETRAPNGGVGYWVQDNGIEAVEHELELAWRYGIPTTLLATIKALAENSALGTLTIPVWGSYSNCRIANVEWGEAQASDAATGYLVRATLTFRQYP